VEPAEIREQFEYLIDTRERFLAKFEELGWDAFQKDRGASWGSALGIYLHILDDEEGWWQIATQGGSTSETPDRQPSDYTRFEQVRQDSDRVSALTRARLAKLTPAELGRAVEFRWPEAVSRPFEQIVTHAWVDELAHVGELICLLWQLDVRPPYLDWIDYRQSRSAPAPPG